MKVLIVEDSKMIAGAVKIILQKEGLEVLSTDDGSKVVEIVKNSAVDLVILDLMMPNVSGEDVFKMLKADAQTKNTKVMILTARTDALKWSKELNGCDSFMKKPFDNQELLTEVKKLLNK